MGEITEIKEDIKQAVNPDASISEQLYQYSATPYPSWLMSSLLLVTPLVLKQPVATTISTGTTTGGFSSVFKRGPQKVKVGPSPLNALLFSGAFALGGFILNDGDIESGTGFVTAWSSLYLIVNGRSAFTGLKYGKPLPLLLAVVAGENAYTHGRRFFFTSNP